ncbi:heterokaryon incompatibility protein-domain-containing protein [Cladorrhinum sp. PSN259]|nr:heterokaryon incompatibility protein-domain-containing protein [Cladorrhinum sp. PSN259]
MAVGAPLSPQPDEYAYTPLPSATPSIRLIELLGCSPEDEIMDISLLAFDLDGAPPFNALSYTWGDPRCSRLDLDQETAPGLSYHQATHEIRCDGRRFMVRPNLRDALGMLLLGPSNVPRHRFVWIDAICIDQSSIDERSSQVQLMARIYERAACIVGWLGPADDTTTDAVSAIERLSTVFPLPRLFDQVKELQRQFAGLTEADFFEPRAYEEKLGIGHVTRAEWLALLAFLYRPYFERAWIMQEVTLARLIVLVCGHHTITWSSLAGTVFFLMVAPRWTFLLNREILPSWVNDPGLVRQFRGLLSNKDARFSSIPLAAVNLVKLRAYARFDLADGALTPAIFSLSAFLNHYRSTSATDPRDKIFALLSMADRTKEPFSDPNAASALAPNYRLSVVAVYTRLARLMIRSYGDLRILQHRELGRLRNLTDLPSWVPDYSVWQQPENMTNAVPGCDWKAGGQEKWTPDGRDLEDPLLTVRGRRVGKVEKVSISGLTGAMMTVIWGSIFDLVTELPWKRFVDGRLIESNVERATSLSLDQDSLPTPVEVLARTVIHDVLGSPSPAPADTLQNQFLAFVAEKYLIAWKSLGKHGDAGRSLRERLIGRLHRFNITHFDRSPGEGRLTPMLKAFRAEPPGSRYGTECFLEKYKEYASYLADEEGADPHSAAYERRRFDDNGGSNPLNGEFRRRSEVSLSCRVVFRTDGGLLLGLGPADMQIDDEVWVLAGADTPAILRPSTTKRRQYSFLGPAFVYGMMHGQAVKHWPDAQDIVLE